MKPGGHTASRVERYWASTNSGSSSKKSSSLWCVTVVIVAVMNPDIRQAPSSVKGDTKVSRKA